MRSRRSSLPTRRSPTPTPSAARWRRRATSADRSSVVLLAVAPTRPETDFGYLEVQDLGGQEGGRSSVSSRSRRGADAAEYVRRGHFWNAGIFVFRPSRLLAEARRVAGGLVAGVERSTAGCTSGDAGGAAAAWEALPAISIDFAVMEKASGVRAVPLARRLERRGDVALGPRAARRLRRAREPHPLATGRCWRPAFATAPIVVAKEGVLVMPFEREGELREKVEGLTGAAPSAPRPTGAGGPRIGEEGERTA